MWYSFRRTRSCGEKCHGLQVILLWSHRCARPRPSPQWSHWASSSVPPPPLRMPTTPAGKQLHPPLDLRTKMQGTTRHCKLVGSLTTTRRPALCSRAFGFDLLLDSPNDTLQAPGLRFQPIGCRRARPLEARGRERRQRSPAYLAPSPSSAALVGGFSVRAWAKVPPKPHLWRCRPKLSKGNSVRFRPKSESRS